ncbi:SDR family NAD(P)-dependent oxidoreductase [Belnapia rosea]|uniref:SDR family NAD(P)-dependent oxidoreductase n=1 Tax=Belnapia rosea TaxID=938405 RepID=UPI0008821865|nr:SDR family NAD(P)-dependent oxidoreductase [Belnapia rosea]SDB73225.1 glucose 1-dehydrogenase [Belnapia rosea]
MQLQDKIVIITGADSGIGQASAEAFAQAGADVAISYHSDAEGAAETRRRVEQAGRRAHVAQVDVGDPASVQALFDGTVQALGTPDILFANAGTGMSGMPVAEMEDAKLEQVLRTDLMGPLFCARAFIRLRRGAGGGGRIVFTGSVAGHLPTPGSAPYGMAKAGLNSLVRSLSVEVAGDRINVNAIAPGLIETPMTQKRMDDPKAREQSMQAIPWRRPGRPEEIAGLAVFLASDAADYVTGQTWVMDGGLTMNWGGA